MYKNIVKPTFDFVFSAIALIILSPLLLITTVVLYFANDGSPFFVQGRPGKNGKIFRLIKFKTMNDKRDRNGELLPDIDRLTPAGRIVRNASIDEILQLVNVLKGDMSLIGPRPLLTEYLQYYSELQARRHAVKPGITGWAQVNGRNAISWNEKFQYDVWYVDNVSFKIDLKIMILTIRSIVLVKNINSSDKVTMERFLGNN